MERSRHSRITMGKILVGAAVVALASGCIRRSEYDALKADMDALRADLNNQIGQRDDQLKTRGQELDDLSSTLKALLKGWAVYRGRWLTLRLLSAEE